MNRKALAVLCSSAMAVGGMFVFTGANAPSKAAAGGAFTSPNNWTGYASGTAAHVDVLHNLVGPTSDNSITKSADIPADPLLFASLLKGNAAANFSTACDTNLPIDPGSSGVVQNPSQAGLVDSRPDLGWGLGNVARAELLNTAAGPPGAPAVVPPLGQPGSQPLLAVENQ